MARGTVGEGLETLVAATEVPVLHAVRRVRVSRGGDYVGIASGNLLGGFELMPVRAFIAGHRNRAFRNVGTGNRADFSFIPATIVVFEGEVYGVALDFHGGHIGVVHGFHEHLHSICGVSGGAACHRLVSGIHDGRIKKSLHAFPLAVPLRQSHRIASPSAAPS